MDISVDELAHTLLKRTRQKGWTLATAESLTAGLVCATLCDIPGASLVVRGGITAYATDVKQSVLGVPASRLRETGPVDGVVAEHMAKGASQVLSADVALATTGVAGPGPSDGHEAGTVYIAVLTPAGSAHKLCRFTGNRRAVRWASVQAVYELALEIYDTMA